MAQIQKRKSADKDLSPELKSERDNARRMVRGKFIFHEVPGGRMDFVYKAYPGDPLQKYTMHDGEIVSVPLGVAKHLNTNAWYPSYTYRNDENGRPVTTIGQKIRRCSFQSLEFMDDDMKSSRRFEQQEAQGI